jgi:hypothetical protein
MTRSGWAYVCGLCVARETAFFSPRSVEELSTLAPGEVVARLGRSFFGPVEPLASFDGAECDRTRRELDEIEKLSPNGVPVDMVRLRFVANELRKGIGELPEGADVAELQQLGQRLALRAGKYADDFAAELDTTLPPLGGASARLAASLLIDSAELAVGLKLAMFEGDAVLVRCATANARLGSGKVALRAVRLRFPRELVEGFFFREPVVTDAGRDFLLNYDEPSALRLYPEGAVPGAEDAFLLRLAGESKGEPFSAARVYHYLLGFLDQVQHLRRVVYVSLGKTLPEAA